MHKETTFPVGNVDFLNLYPLNFKEFLIALGENELANLVSNNNFSLISAFSNSIKNYLKQYFFIGGMPEVVASYIEEKNLKKVRNIQNRLLESYEQYFSKHAPNSTIPKIRQLWNNIPIQLAKENKKFIYSLMKQGARAREYELALSWLKDCGLVYQVNRTKENKIPLSAYQDLNVFKLYILDVGLLCAMAKIDESILLEEDRILVEFKEALTEQFVIQELKSNTNIPIFYWSSEHGNAELSYIVQAGKYNIPIEVKANENLMSKNLKSFVSKFNSKINIRTSISDYRKEEWFINVPLYTIGNIEKTIKKLNI